MDRDQGYLGTLLGKHAPLAATVALAVVSGLDLSPVFDTVSFYLASFARNSPLFHPELFYYLTSLAISVMTLLLAGIPAALYERVRGLQTSSPVSLAIWLAGTLLLALPVILRALAPVED